MLQYPKYLTLRIKIYGILTIEASQFGEKDVFMSKDEQERITLPIEWHVPDSVQNKYVHDMIVQHGKYEVTLFFFESQIPPFAGSPEANREYLQKHGSVRFECVGKMTVAPQLVPEIIKALQTGLDNYNAAKAREEREANI